MSSPRHGPAALLLLLHNTPKRSAAPVPGQQRTEFKAITSTETPLSQGSSTTDSRKVEGVSAATRGRRLTRVDDGDEVGVVEAVAAAVMDGATPVSPGTQVMTEEDIKAMVLKATDDGVDAVLQLMKDYSNSE